MMDYSFRTIVMYVKISIWHLTSREYIDMELFCLSDNVIYIYGCVSPSCYELSICFLCMKGF